VKCLSNPEIAGSPRKGFRVRPPDSPGAGRELVGDGGTALTNSTQTTNGPRGCRRSETQGAKLLRQEGNSPDHPVRSRSGGSVEKEVGARRQPGGWLRSSHPRPSA